MLRMSVSNSDSRSMSCSESDQEAFIDFKDGLEDPDNCLSHGKPGPIVVSGMKPSLTKLKSLRHSDLSFNGFNDIPIPEFFGSLVNQQYLNLSNAGFSGLTPPSLGNLTCLQHLDVGIFSSFAESLDWISGLVSFKHLVLDGANLSRIESDWMEKLDGLLSLTELHLSRCNLCAPNSTSLNFSNITPLALVDFSYNMFNLKAPLVNVDINRSGLHGRIPLCFTKLPNLRFLYHFGNDLRASCPQFFRCSWKKIQELGLDSNELHGKLPASIGNMTFLTYFDLSGNNVQGEMLRI
ncbi:hypothetical protein TIFTF001_039644 [Ficus carica]|uniref:Uncharacterized protein n=1 Tax=Ficus carica TaxID=3494 RepID=A0AA88EAA7_FICCA|nr:hypothetical protein TIFTF001_039639 [Ficus carica]GMN70603.1 hypothetical protein TIFTF001_039644 [Ficus carica]